MQISRHWRLNAQRYRLQGTEFEDGSYSLQQRPVPVEAREDDAMPPSAPNKQQDETLTVLQRAAS